MEKKIKIAHLYYDIMNLYGENGNVRALKRFIERQGVSCEIDCLTLGDDIDFKKYDIYYLGAGSEENEYMVLSELYPYRKEIKEAVDDGKTFLITGNALEIFGKKIKPRNSKEIAGLGIFDFNSIESKDRIVSDLFYEFDELEPERGRNIVGFKNCGSNIVNNDYDRMFKFQDNIHYNNFYGMIFVGPVCIRNPYFTDYILQNLFKKKNLEYKPQEDSLEYKAYHEFVNNFIINGNFD